jgi:thiamine-phosphate pyrophosphorylase
MTSETLRILDASLNRAREALRLIEDYARFALDAPDLVEALKTLRHDLAAATVVAGAAAILARDTPGDVGTGITTPAEARRADLASAVVAAGKRFGEAARVIEEVLKTTDPRAAATVEGVRYRFYKLEKRVAVTLRPADTFASVRLYVILTESACRADWLSTAAMAISGGADALQLREPGLPARELLSRARRLRDLCRETGTFLIVNDRPDVAILARAHGVHVGQGDLPASDVRRLIGPRMILGVSTHSLEQLTQARLDGADYAGVGPVFPSQTKPRPEMADRLPGLDFARSAAAAGVLPTVAIAGITLQNVQEVWETGVSAVAVASAVTQSEDPAAVVRQMKSAKGST